MRDMSEQGRGRGGWDLPGGGLERPDSPAEEERMARLVRTIEGEIVPRLVLTRRVSGMTGEVEEGVIKAPDAADVTELVRLLLNHEADVASGYVEGVRQRGATMEMICLELLAPAARELGLLWEQDECNFMDVTVGLCRLHQVLREISGELIPEKDAAEPGRCVLLAPMPGEQHTFGIMLVAQFLRRAGWEVWHEFPENLSDILSAVREHWFSVVGLSMGCDTQMEDVAAVIRSIRNGSRNRAVGILVGGPALVANPEVAALVGADATASDGRQAVLEAEHICKQRMAMN